jgi:hypothetical protein
MADEDDRGTEELVSHLVATSGLERQDAARVVDEVVAFFSETPDAFVRRRHRELQRDGLANPEIFARVARELARRPVAAPRLSERQIRRLVYG